MNMNEVLKKYSEILDINYLNHSSIFNLCFKDNKLYKIFILQYKYIRLITSSLIHIFFRSFLSLQRTILILFIYTLITPWFFSFDIGLFYHFVVKNTHYIKRLNFTFSILVCLINAYSATIPQFFFNICRSCIQVREFYFMVIISLLDILFCYEYNIYFSVFLWVMNIGISIIIMIMKIQYKYQKYMDLLVALF